MHSLNHHRQDEKIVPAYWWTRKQFNLTTPLYRLKTAIVFLKFTVCDQIAKRSSSPWSASCNILNKVEILNFRNVIWNAYCITRKRKSLHSILCTVQTPERTILERSISDNLVHRDLWAINSKQRWIDQNTLFSLFCQTAYRTKQTTSNKPTTFLTKRVEIAN